MSQLLEDFSGVKHHADAILVFCRNKLEHDQHLKNVLKKLTLNEKCEFAKTEMLFIGHKITERGLEADPSKVRAILHMPEAKADVSKVLGMANYLAKFLPQLA